MNIVKNNSRILSKIGLCVVLSLFLCVGCMKEEEETVALPMAFEVIPNSMVPTEIVDSLRKYMDINEGKYPPVVEGSYVANPMKVVYASDDYYNDNFYDVYFVCASQQCRGFLSYIERQNTAVLGTDSAVVIGNDDRFTLTYISKMQDNVQGWNCKLATIVSGTKSQGGIHNYEYATVMLEKSDPNDVLLDVYDFRVYRDEDSFAKDTVWDYNKKTPTQWGHDITCGKTKKGEVR